MMKLKGRSRLFSVVAVLFTVASACGSSGSGSDTTTTDAASEVSPTNPIDGLTSATPGIVSALLSDAHEGWAQANCASCHDLSHGGFVSSDCVVCHSTNGATLRDQDHATGDCAPCHGEAHASAGESVLGDCASCHGFEVAEGCSAVVETDVVVIGAGGGGLSAATYLTQAGKSVVVLEKHSRVGGYMTGFQRGGYHFEASLHAMGGFDAGGSGAAQLERLGILDRVQPVKADFPYRTFYPDLTFDTPEALEDYREKLKQDFPDEAQGIDDLFALFAKTEEVMTAFSELGYVGALEKYGETEPETVLQFLTLIDQTVTELYQEYVSDPKLIAILSQLTSFIGEPPETLSALYYILMWNSYHNYGFYNFVGGSQSVSDALAEVIREKGGVIHVNTAATKIVVEDGRAVEVRAEDGVCYRPKWVVSNANVPATIEMVGRENLSADWLEKIDAMEMGRPVLVVYLGVNHDYVPDFEGTHEWMIQDGYDTAAVFDELDGCEPARGLVMVTNYSVLDPTAAPEGKNVITLTGIMNDSCNDDWKFADLDAYKGYKESVAKAYVERVEAYLPGLSEHLEVVEVAAPQTLRGFTGNPRGTIFGWSHTPEQSTVKRLAPETPIENLFLAGMWTFPGAGQQAVLQSGEAAAKLILDREASAGQQ